MGSRAPGMTKNGGVSGAGVAGGIGWTKFGRVSGTIEAVEAHGCAHRRVRLFEARLERFESLAVMAHIAAR